MPSPSNTKPDTDPDTNRAAGDDPTLWVVSYPGLRSYRPMWDLQGRLFRARLAGTIPDTLLLLEHTPVVTLGKNARREHLLGGEGLLRQRGVEVVEVDRGGDVTYHGPGQLVGYWIFDLRGLYQDVHRFLREIEESIIRLLARYGIEGERDPRATGVWVKGEKIAAMGLHLSHWVSTHGFAFNLNTDLTPFTWIVPCGLHGRGVTSLARILNTPVARSRVEEEITREIGLLFRRNPEPLGPEDLEERLVAVEGTGNAAEETPTCPV